MPFTCTRKLTFIFVIILLTCAVSALVDDYDDDDDNLEALRSFLASGITKALPGIVEEDDPPPENSRQDEIDDDVHLRYPRPSQKEKSKGTDDVIRYWLQTKRANIKSSKRNINCMWKCLKQGKLHASQCHSLC